MRRRSILTLFLTLFAAASEPEPLAQRALAELRAGHMQTAYDLTRGTYLSGPEVAAVHLAAAQRVAHPLEVAALCAAIVPEALEAWKPAPDLLRTCGWHLLATRTHKVYGELAASGLLELDPFDDNARGLRLAMVQMEPIPIRKWAPPPPGRAPGIVRQRRKRDFQYLYDYVRPEHGEAGLGGGIVFLPEGSGLPTQVRERVRLRWDLRPHEIVPAGYRVTHALPRDVEAPERSTTHQLYGGYRLAIWRKNPLQLDASVILGKGRDEGAVRFRTERVGLGVWNAEAAAVWTPWGEHAALGLGWVVFLDGLAQVDLQVEGQAGNGPPRGLVELGLERWFGNVGVIVRGQAGRAVRPLGDALLIRDLPGIEGLGGDLTVRGTLSEHFRASASVGMRRLSSDDGTPGATAGLAHLELVGVW